MGDATDDEVRAFVQNAILAAHGPMPVEEFYEAYQSPRNSLQTDCGNAGTR